MWHSRFMVITGCILAVSSAACGSDNQSSPLVEFISTPVVEPYDLYLVDTTDGTSNLVSSTPAFPKVDWAPHSGAFTLQTDPPSAPGRKYIVAPDAFESFTVENSEDLLKLNDLRPETPHITRSASLEVTSAGLEYRTGDKVAVLATADPDWEIKQHGLSPDGRWATYVRYPSSNRRRQYSVELSGDVQRLPDPPDSSTSAAESCVSFDTDVRSPDGEAIAFFESKRDGTGIYVSRGDAVPQLMARMTGRLCELLWIDDDTLVLTTDVTELGI